jgi:hypothetical protein
MGIERCWGGEEGILATTKNYNQLKRRGLTNLNKKTAYE